MNYKHGLIIGAQVYFVQDGTAITGSPTGSCGATLCPVLPEVNAALPTSSPWLSMGRILTAESEFSNKDIDVEGCDDSLDIDALHGYTTDTLTIQNKKAYKFTTKSLTREAFELAHGRLATDEAPYIQGWLYARHIDVLGDEGAQELSHVAVYGRLKLDGALGASSDAATVSWRLDIIKNSLAAAALDGVETLLGN